VREHGESDSQAWWDSLANRLDGFQGTYQSSVICDSGEDEFVRMIREKLAQFPVALDIGCADGRFTHAVASEAESMTGVDFSPVMIEKAKQTTTNDNCSFMVADAKRLPFPDHNFDLIISRRGPVSAPVFLEEAIRVTKPGGQLVEITIGEKDACEFKEIFQRGQGYGAEQIRSMALKKRLEDIPSIRMVALHEYCCTAVYPSIEDVALLLSSTPIIEDFEIEQDYPYLKQIEQRCTSSQGIERTMHRIIWAVERI